MNRDKIISVLKGAVVALAGGGVAAMLAYLDAVNWSATGGPIAGALVAICINALRKYLQKEAGVAHESDE